jgi:nucleoside-diphosphate-sugar epimerase
LLHQNYIFEDDFFLKNGYPNIEILIHAGAFIPKLYRESNDVSENNSNIFSTSRLVNAQIPNLKKIIFISSVDVYKSESVITEESAAEPVSLYGYSKLYCEKMITASAVQKEVVSQILRIGHVYGPGEEKFQKIIPLTMSRLLSSEPVSMYGNGNEIRSFIYISDVVDAILNSLKLDTPMGVINVAGEEKITIKELIDNLISISGKNIKIERRPETTKPRDLVFDNNKMKSLLHKPVVPLANGLKEEWMYMKSLY